MLYYLNKMKHETWSHTLTEEPHYSAAIRCRLLTVMACVQSQVGSCGICGWQSGTGIGFARVRQFRLSFLVPPAPPRSFGSVIVVIWG
jgi:hypothetical protein